MRHAWVALVLVTAALAGCAGSEPSGEDASSCDFPDAFDTSNPVALMCTNFGGIALELYGDLTPQTVQNFGNLSQSGYYDEVKFHRVIPDFVIQGGDPNTKQPESRDNRWGGGGPGYRIVDEFPCQDGNISHQWTGYDSEEEPCDDHGGLVVTHDGPGVLSMANTGQPKTGGSQFFLTLAATPHLDGTHTVFGETLDGLDVIQTIGQVETNNRDQPVQPVVIESVTIEGELPGVHVEKH